MKQKTHTDGQILQILREAEEPGVAVLDVCRKHNISDVTFYRWRKKWGGLDESAMQRLKELERENARLKKVVAEQVLAIDGLKELNEKKW